MTMRFWITALMVMSTTAHAQVKPYDDAFKKQWYAGLAEITRYELKQARYGDVHTGDAVFIFVTEDFLTDKQVKHERGDGAKTSVLKLNFARTFNTGIYPYSMMTSVFTPVDPNQTHALKVTTSVQEWCGHTFTQFNYRDGQYKGILRSYFQDESDRDFNLPGVELEDNLWLRIRLTPDQLPTGTIQLIPGTQFQRLTHVLPDVQTATAERISKGATQIYRVTYMSLARKLYITYETAYPHAIIAWEESYQQRGQWVTTTAKKTHSMMLDYWSKHAAADSTYRKKLGLK